ncbi:hypothetical protein A2721_01935 [Candidatus Gottesmanbacteria bacterium RIFCSPHIGHO2_01_FULL_47_48]|uniref:Glycosyltransferase RgtA/B/C/D-like domain-containing protein n=1 Tax=Candidatus Gottesmanbacteria bacterium RIFCSPHIGHO2_01_FULL_47_48 TaxID=1798381 RepID=A0A1F6A4G2_9BACT|nr:MAG: hypothetical protein A2721_01935 [Candidatus Gottesmanbacteria bacterium RIFCSPHIGHO2_01_FULL_47_48]
MKPKIVAFFTSLTLLLIVQYRNALVSPFFQDDFELLSSASPEYFLKTVPDFHYHPISNQIFYFASYSLFAHNPFGYHLIHFVITILSPFLLYQISKILLRSQRKALLATFFYGLNISLFALYYWIAVSYFVFGSLFFFLTIFLYLKSKNSFWPTLSFVLALLSNELALVVPGVLFLISFYLRKWSKTLLAIIFTDLIFIFLKFFWIGFPVENAYKIELSTQVFATLRWYLLRAFNLPEGVLNFTNTHIFLVFIVFVAIILLSLHLYVRSTKQNWRLFILGPTWFLIGALPFFFLPGHMSAYYIAFSLPGMVIIFAEILSPRKLILLLAMLLYLAASTTGLDFLSQTHWTILKPTR